MGLAAGLGYGLAQDAVQLTRGRRLGYVDFLLNFVGRDKRFEDNEHGEAVKTWTSSFLWIRLRCLLHDLRQHYSNNEERQLSHSCHVPRLNPRLMQIRDAHSARRTPKRLLGMWWRECGGSNPKLSWKVHEVNIVPLPFLERTSTSRGWGILDH